ncbi:hypothetical protein VTO73DRAFT_2483 [Trametes versicolor]
MPRPGRPRILTPRDLDHLKLVLARGEAANATEAQRLAAPQASARTVRRNLSEDGLYGRVRREKPYLSALNVKQRRTWAQEVAGWGMDQWRLVVFSDESKFNLFGSDGRQWCRRRVGEEFLDRNVKKRMQGGGGSVMVWGCITSKGVGRLHRIEGIMDAKKYCTILEEALLGTLQDHHLNPRTFIFQQDNDRKHTSKLAQRWFDNQNILLLPWPSSSPDMNIIEHVWSELDRRVRARNPLPRNCDELWTALQEEWYGLDSAFIQRLYDSLPERVKALKAAKGHHTRY